MHKPYGSNYTALRQNIVAGLWKQETVTVPKAEAKKGEMTYEIGELVSSLTGLRVLWQQNGDAVICWRTDVPSEEEIEKAINHAFSEGWSLLDDVCGMAHAKMYDDAGRLLSCTPELIGVVLGKMVCAGKVEQNGALFRLVEKK